MRIRFPFLVLGVALATGAVADDLPAGTRSVLTRESVPETSVSIVVRDAASNNTLLQVNGAMPRSPASTMKILPTWAALDLLGPAYAWKTRAYTDVPVVKGVLKGNLYLQGGGDPLLTIERWWRFVNDLRQTGLRVIEGDIVIDQTRFTASDERPEDFDGKSWKTYNVLPDAMLVNWQSSDFTIRPADDGNGIDISVQPYPDGLVVENRVKLVSGRCVGHNSQVSYSIEPTRPDRVVATGRLSSSCGPQSQRLAIMDPAQYAMARRDALAPAGRPVPRRDAARADAAGRAPAAHARVRAAFGDRARHQQVFEQHDGALARARARGRDAWHAGDDGGRTGDNPQLAQDPRTRAP
jgi:D-alanyl-D-alanine carboxypeptidase/D-alanyl-D-alanine-endopeptidase (penicillin-binding protein 4)